MGNVEGSLENGILRVFLRGRINSANSDQIEAEVQTLKKSNPDSKMVLDARDLEYISSAGLRILLRLRKEKQDLSIINVSSEVYEIFDMTGFNEIMTIEKAYRSFQ